MATGIPGIDVMGAAPKRKFPVDTAPCLPVDRMSDWQLVRALDLSSAPGDSPLRILVEKELYEELRERFLKARQYEP
jgi:hypothetical protein